MVYVCILAIWYECMCVYGMRVYGIWVCWVYLSICMYMVYNEYMVYGCVYILGICV